MKEDCRTFTDKFLQKSACIPSKGTDISVSTVSRGLRKEFGLKSCKLAKKQS